MTTDALTIGFITGTLPLAIASFFIRKWISGVDKKINTLFAKQERLNVRLARLEGREGIFSHEHIGADT